MAPEQLEGQEADARTDIFAFGAVAVRDGHGKRAFEGKSQASLIAAIISREPPPIAAASRRRRPRSTRRQARAWRRIRKALADRERSGGRELQWIAARVGTGRAECRRRSPRGATAWAIVRLALAAALLIAASVRASAFTTPAPMAGAGAGSSRVPTCLASRSFTLSPDGRHAGVFRPVATAGPTAVFVRPFDPRASQKLAGTEGAGLPFGSPDSRWIAFFAGGRLKSRGAGGPPQNTPRRPTAWRDLEQDGVILFASEQRACSACSAAGGTTLSTGPGCRVIHRRRIRKEPYFLPGGDLLLVHSRRGWGV